MFAFTAAGLLTLCLRCVHGVVGFLALMSAVFSTLINLHATMLFVRASLLHHSISILFSFCASLRACNSTTQAAASLAPPKVHMIILRESVRATA